jgi:predicted nucleic acid-binding protein
MTKTLIDTSYLYALNDAQDRNHAAAVHYLQNLTAQLFLPTPVLPELCYLLHSRLSHVAMQRFLTGLLQSDIELVPIINTDLIRAVEILARYADARLDFTDSMIVAMAERLDIERIMTFDRRDFSLIRPQHCSAFEVLP